MLRSLLALAFLPYEAIISLAAILTTVIRLLLQRRGLLQWTTAAHTAGRWGNHIRPRVTWRQMIAAVLFSILIAGLLVSVNLTAFMVALPILLIWVISPQLAFLISRPIQWEQETLAEEQIARLRALARHTWMFFEQFVGPEEHWLPPDHYQESPRNVVAHRTSPTNMGLGLLSTLAAYDLGYIEVLDFVTRLQTTFESLLRLERYRGHFFNWYDISNLQPLPPRYISTVDSGNLAVSLVALREGCSSLIDQPVFRRASWQGLGDLLALLIELLENTDDDLVIRDSEPLVTYLTAFRRHLESVMEDPALWYSALRQLSFKGDVPGEAPEE